MNLNETLYWIWLSKLRNMGENKLKILLQKYKNIENIFYAKKDDLLKIDGIGEDIAKEITDATYKQNLVNIYEYMKSNHIYLINIYDKYYPQKLKHIYSSPICLYVQGNKEILNSKAISIIGCRQATSYGKSIGFKMSSDLAKIGITIISGMAKGIDAVAHMGALKANGKTIAVLGSSFDNIYPKENYSLYKNILLNGGAVISEYPPFSKIEKSNFVQRNRIISGLSDGVLVVEARRRSGSNITVDFALEQGKDIYAIPGNIDVPTSQGTNILIKEGAIPVTNVEDITGYKNGV